MMARKDRFPVGFPAGYSPTYGSEGSASSGRADTDITHSENSRVPKRKVFNLNFGRCDSLGVPTQVLPLSKMSPAERKNLLFRLKAELEQIRGFHRRVETQRINSIALSSSSAILNCSNIAKSSSRQDSVPGRNVNPPGIKARGGNRSLPVMSKSAGQPVPNTSNTILMKQCEALLKKLMQHQYGWVFNTPVDVVKLNIPDYFTVIKHPMDLGTVKRKIESGEYSTPLDFAADVRLTFSNAMTYNPRGNDVHLMADDLRKFFEIRWKVIQRKLPKESQSVQEKSGVFEEKEVVKPTPPSKKRKITSMQIKPPQKPVVRKMTNEEKLKLSGELEELLGELPDNIVEFLKDQTLNGRETGVEEIEIDIDVLSDETLFKLRKLLDDYILEKQKNQGKAEPCEIELLNDSGPSNSSMLLCKGNDPVDEDVDIGGNEPPVSSFPPVKLEHDKGDRSTSNGHSVKEGYGPDREEKLFVHLHLDSSKTGKEPSGVKASSPPKPTKVNTSPEVNVDEDTGVVDLLDENPEINSKSVNGLEPPEINSENLNYVNLDSLPDGESAGNETQLSPERSYRAAVLKERFADTILKAREKTLVQSEKGDPDKMRRAREELEAHKKKEKARLQAEARAAEVARRRAEAIVEAEAKRRRDLEREAARQALQMMEKTVEINENSRFLEDLEMLRAVPPEQLPSSADEASPEQPQDPLGSFNFRGSNALEQLGLFMKLDDDEEEGEPPSNIPHISDDMEEGEVDEEEDHAPKIIPSVVEEGEMGEAHEESAPPNKFPSSVDDVEEGEVGKEHEAGNPENNFPSIIVDVEEGKVGDDYKDCKALDNISSMADDVGTEEMDEDREAGEQLDKILPGVTDVGVGDMDEDHEGELLDNISKVVDNIVEGAMRENHKEGGENSNVPNIVDGFEVGELLDNFTTIVDNVVEGGASKNDEESSDIPNIVANLDGVELGRDNKEGDTLNDIPNIVNFGGGEMHDISTIVDNVGEGYTCMDNKEGDASYYDPTIVDDVDAREIGGDHEENGSLNFSSGIIDMGKDDKEGDAGRAPNNIPSILDDVDIGEMHTDQDKDESLPDISKNTDDNVKEGEIAEDDKDGGDAPNSIPGIVADVVDVAEMEEDREGSGSLNDISRNFDNVKEAGGDEPHCNPSIVDDVGLLEEAHKDHEDGSVNEDVSRIVDNVKEVAGDEPDCNPSIVDDVDLLEEAHKDHDDGSLNDDVSRIVDDSEEGEKTKDDRTLANVPNIVDDVAVGEMDTFDPEVSELLNDMSKIVDTVKEGEKTEDDDAFDPEVGEMDTFDPEVSEFLNNMSKIMDNVEEGERTKDEKEGDAPNNISSSFDDVYVGEVGLTTDIPGVPNNVEMGNVVSGSDDLKGENDTFDPEVSELLNDMSKIVDNVEEGAIGKDEKEGNAPSTISSSVDDVYVGEITEVHGSDISGVPNNVEDVEMGNVLSGSDDLKGENDAFDPEVSELLNDMSKIVDNMEEGAVDKDEKEGNAPHNISSSVDDVYVGGITEVHGSDISGVPDNVEDVEMGNVREDGKGQPPSNIPSIVDDDMEEDVVVVD